jgi:DNA repair exonuclease SbcCD nuclease subunit
MPVFLHTADLQIGMTAGSVGGLAKSIQTARYESLRHILELAALHRAHFVVIAGDLFETNLVSAGLVREVMRLLENAQPMRVYLLPGNHDHLGPDSVYAREEFRRAGSHIHVFTDTSPVVVEDLDLTLYPVPCLETRSPESPARSVRKIQRTRHHVAVLHGSLPERFGGGQEEDEYFPMTEEELRGLGMDYIALGHWHSLNPDPEKEPLSPFYYSGTPEPTGFGEKKSGNVLLVDLEGGKRSVQALATAQYRFVDVAKEIRTLPDADLLKNELLRLPLPEKTLLRVNLRGIVSLDVEEAISTLITELEERFAFVRREDRELLIEPSERDLDRFTRGGIAHTKLTLLKAKREGSLPEDLPVYNRAISLAYKTFRGEEE